MSDYLDCTVTLDHVEPSIWRRFLLTAEATVEDLHLAIQDACGWENYHLYSFTTSSGTRFGIPDVDAPDTLDAAAHPVVGWVDDLRAGRSTTLEYLYDFGDAWSHTVHLTLVDEPGTFHRRLRDGARAFPPEDCGGIGGYTYCVDVLRGVQDDPERREWIGAWDPERYDHQAVAARFDAEQRPEPAAVADLVPLPRPGDTPTSAAAERYFTAQRLEGVAAGAQSCVALERLRRFTAWADEGHRLTGTGNLALSDGAALIEVLGTDDVFNPRIGDRVFKTRSSAELTGVQQVFRVARKAGFVKVRTGRVFATRRGQTLGRQPVTDWNDAFSALRRLGILHLQYEGNRYFDPFWKDLLDESLPGILEFMAGFVTPLPLATLQAAAWDLVQANFMVEELETSRADMTRRFVGDDTLSICAVLADFGVVALSGRDELPEDAAERSTTGAVALTELGRGLLASP